MTIPGQFSRKVCFGEFELNLETAELKSNGNKVILPGQPFQVLVTPHKSSGRACAAQGIEDTIVDCGHIR
jgi:hypothetical protein